MDQPEKRATYGTQDTRRIQTKQKHNTICVGHHYSQAKTNNVTRQGMVEKTLQIKQTNDQQQSHYKPRKLNKCVQFLLH